MSAAVGKLGALAPTIFFNYIGNRAKFWAVCWAGLLGFLVTVVFVPDATGTHSKSHHSHWSHFVPWSELPFVLCLLKNQGSGNQMKVFYMQPTQLIATVLT